MDFVDFVDILGSPRIHARLRVIRIVDLCVDILRAVDIRVDYAVSGHERATAFRCMRTGDYVRIVRIVRKLGNALICGALSMRVMCAEVCAHKGMCAAHNTSGLGYNSALVSAPLG